MNQCHISRPFTSFDLHQRTSSNCAASWLVLDLESITYVGSLNFLLEFREAIVQSFLWNLICNFPNLRSNFLPLIWRHFVNPFWNYSFLQHIEGHSDSHTCWFRWTRSCPASSGNCLRVHCILYFFVSFDLGTFLCNFFMIFNCTLILLW